MAHDNAQVEKLREKIAHRLGVASVLEKAVKDDYIRGRVHQAGRSIADIERFFLVDLGGTRTEQAEALWLSYAETAYEFASTELATLEKVISETGGPDMTAPLAENTTFIPRTARQSH